MEEMWKDITLTGLHREGPISTSLEHRSYHHHHHQTSSPSFRGMILQDFLTEPLNRPPAISPPAVQELPLRPSPFPLAVPQTALSLHSGGLEFQCLGPDANSHSNSSSSGQNASFISSALSAVIASPPSPTGLLSFCLKKRMQENYAIGVDRHHKRMIKNRESAARSRARKQAYTNELELEAAHLKEENAKLKKQHEELRLAMATQLHKRSTLQRSSTAPF